VAQKRRTAGKWGRIGGAGKALSAGRKRTPRKGANVHQRRTPVPARKDAGLPLLLEKICEERDQRARGGFAVSGHFEKRVYVHAVSKLQKRGMTAREAF